MSKIKLLLDVVSDMNALADSIQAVADAMLENEPTDTMKQPEPIKEIKTKKASTPKVKKIKFEDVRGLLATKSQAGMTDKVRGLIQKYGATKLSEIDPKHYADVLKDAEELTNG